MACWPDVYRQLKKDSVPTVAYSDSFDEAGSNGTLHYYLASAFDQIYVPEAGQVSFTGESTKSIILYYLTCNVMLVSIAIYICAMNILGKYIVCQLRLSSCCKKKFRLRSKSKGYWTRPCNYHTPPWHAFDLI